MRILLYVGRTDAYRITFFRYAIILVYLLYSVSKLYIFSLYRVKKLF